MRGCPDNGDRGHPSTLGPGPRGRSLAQPRGTAQVSTDLICSTTQAEDADVGFVISICSGSFSGLKAQDLLPVLDRAACLPRSVQTREAHLLAGPLSSLCPCCQPCSSPFICPPTPPRVPTPEPLRQMRTQKRTDLLMISKAPAFPHKVSRRGGQPLPGPKLHTPLKLSSQIPDELIPAKMYWVPALRRALLQTWAEVAVVGGRRQIQSSGSIHPSLLPPRGAHHTLRFSGDSPYPSPPPCPLKPVTSRFRPWERPGSGAAAAPTLPLPPVTTSLPELQLGAE